MSKKDENLKELFGRFMDEEQAAKSAEDIADGERLLNEHPAPQPDAKHISFIKMQVNAELKRIEKPVRLPRWSWAVTAAAVIVIVLGLLTTYNHKTVRPVSGPVITETIWDSDDLSKQDAEFALLVAQAQEIEDELISLQLDEGGINGLSAEELEIEFLEISNDFWKG